MMNVNAQACFAMGVTVLEPDISKIKGENIPAK
jgi:hypothetical protein